MRRKLNPGSLATQISVSTLGLVSIAVLLAAVLALGGVYNMARSEADARISAFRDVLHETVSDRLIIAEELLESIAAEVSGAMDAEALRQATYRHASRSEDYFDAVMVADLGGRVRTSYPPGSSKESVLDEPYFGTTGPGTGFRYTWIPGEEPGQPGRAWLSTSVRGVDETFILAARLRVGFLSLVLAEMSAGPDERVAAVVARDDLLVDIGGGVPGIDPAEFVYTPDEESESEGKVFFEHPELGRLDGFYSEVRPAHNLGWRVLVLEPETVVLERTQDALLPASLSILLASLVAMYLSYVFGRRLVAPLRVLEEQAQAVSAGSAVKPIDIDREDEVGRLATAFNSMAARLGALRELSMLLASSAELEQVLEGIINAMEHIVGSRRTAVFLAEEGGAQLKLVKAGGVRAHRPLAIPTVSDSWISEAFRTGDTVSFLVESDVSGDPALEVFGGDQVKSGLVVPLSVGHRPFGVVLTTTTESRLFSEAELEMARAFSAQAAIAVENSRLFENEHRSRMEAEALRDMAEVLAGPKGLSETLHEVGDIAADLLGMSGSFLALCEKAREGEEVYEEDKADDYLALWKSVGVSSDASTASPVVVEGLARRRGAGRLAGRWGVASVILVPLIEGGELQGVLALECSDEKRTFTPRDVRTARATARTLAVALETNRLAHQTRRRAENLEMVFRISQAVALSLRSSVVLNRVMDVVQKMLPNTGVLLMQQDPTLDVMRTVMVRGIEDKRMLEIEVAPGDDVPGAVFESRRSRRIDDVNKVGTPLAKLFGELGYEAWLAAPLLARGRSIGVLNLLAHEGERFTDEDTELLSTFAAQAALALDTAELFEKEHTIATVLQKSIVPESLPEIEGIELASTYQPAGSESEIGGDYYDVFRAPDGRVVLAIGDVCGKGVRAATKTSTIKYTLRGLVAAGLGPSAAVREVNRAVVDMGDVADIVTMWVGFFDIETGKLTFANAGHPPGLLRNADGSVEELGPTGPLLGAMADADYRKGSVDVPRGSTLLLYTDGVTEARSAKGFFGEERLHELLSWGAGPQTIIDYIIAAVLEHTEGILKDDVAMLAAEYPVLRAEAVSLEAT